MQTSTLSVPAVILTISHQNDDEDDRFGGTTNFASELWGNRNFSNACQAIFKRVGVSGESVFPFGGYSMQHRTTLCVIALPGATQEEHDEAFQDRAWVESVEKRFSMGFRGNCTLTISPTRWPEENPFWNLGEDYFGTPPCIHPLWGCAAFRVRSGFEGEQGMNDAILEAHKRGLVRRSLPPRQGGVQKRNIRHPSAKDAHGQGQEGCQGTVAVTGPRSRPGGVPTAVPSKKRKQGAESCSPSPQPRAIPTRRFSQRGRADDKNEDEEEIEEPPETESERSDDDDQLEPHDLHPPTKRLRISTANDAVFPPCGYKEFKYFVPGSRKNAEDVLTESPLFAYPGRVIAGIMHQIRRRRPAKPGEKDTYFSYIVFKSVDVLVKHVYNCPPDGRVFNITVEPDREVSFYADLEWKVNGRPDRQKGKHLLQASLDVFEVCLKELYGPVLAEAWKEATTCFCATITGKFSYHVYSDVVFASIVEHGAFMEYVKDALQSARNDPQHALHHQAKLLYRTGKDGKPDWFIDFGVYTKNRNFRLAANSKPGKGNPLLLVQDDGISVVPEPDDFATFREWILRSIIISPGKDAPRLPLLPGRSQTKKAASCGSAANASPLEEAVLEMVREPPDREGTDKGWEGFPDAFFEGTSDGGFMRFNHHDRSQACPFGSRSHDHKGIWARVDPRTGMITLGCYGTACGRKKYTLGRISADLLPLSDDAQSIVKESFSRCYPHLVLGAMQYREGGKELAITVNSYRQCEMTSRRHDGLFESEFVVLSTGQGRWRCKHRDCEGQEGTNPPVKFLKNQKQRDIVFPRAAKRRSSQDASDIPPEVLAVFKKFDQRYKVVQAKSSMVVADLEASDDAIEGPVVALMTEPTFLLRYRNCTMVLDDGKKIQCARAWLDWPGRMTYEGITVDPTGERRPNMLNLWQGFTVEPLEGDCSMQLDYRLRLICGNDKESFEYLLNLEAFIVQNPEKLLRVAIVLLGDEGVGKSTLANMMGSFFGSGYKRISHQSMLSNRFNAFLLNTLVLFVDEATWPGDKAGEGYVKSIITDSQMMLELKGVDPYPMQNRAKLILSSNMPYVVPAGLADRRWAPFRVSDERKQDANYFKDLEHNWNHEGAKEAYLHLLLHRDISNFDPTRDRPRRVIGELWLQKMYHMNPVESWWYQVLARGSLFDGGIPGTAPQWPTEVRLEELFRSYRHHFEQCSSNKAAMIKNPQLLWNELKNRMLPEGDYNRRCASMGWGERRNTYPLPTLQDCRTHYASRVTQTPYDIVFPEEDQQGGTPSGVKPASGEENMATVFEDQPGREPTSP